MQINLNLFFCFFLSLQGLGGEFVGVSRSEHMVWYVLFIIFAAYAMLPLPLRWSLAAGAITALVHLICFVSLHRFEAPSAYQSPYLVRSPFYFLVLKLVGLNFQIAITRVIQLNFK